MKITPASRRSKNIIDLRAGACGKLKSPQEEAACLEKRITHREQVMDRKKRKKKKLPPIVGGKKK